MLEDKHYIGVVPSAQAAERRRLMPQDTCFVKDLLGKSLRFV
jgi:hypothetical protein